MTHILALCMNPAIDVSTSVDHVVPTRKLRCSAQKRDPGGGGINVARVVQRLGGDVTAVYPEGGLSGKLLRHLLDQEEVASVTVPAAEETREDFTVTEHASHSQFRFVLPGPHLAEREWRECLKAVVNFKNHARFIVASGSLPLGVPADFYGAIARVAKEMGAKFVLDTSDLPLKLALAEGAYLIKPNLRELRELAGTELKTESDWVAAARHVTREGQAEVVALTLGDQGALLVTREEAWRAQPLPISAISAVGAGDSFLAGIVWSLASGHDLKTAFAYGAAAGSAAVLVPGTGLCHAEDVKRLYGQVVVRSLCDH